MCSTVQGVLPVSLPPQCLQNPASTAIPTRSSVIGSPRGRAARVTGASAAASAPPALSPPPESPPAAHSVSGCHSRP